MSTIQATPQSKRYFTIQFSDSTGLADQLINHLSLLYGVGVACQYEYIHMPMQFPRSWKSPTVHDGLERFYQGCVFGAGLKLPTFVAKGLRLLCNRLALVAKRLPKSKRDGLADFLGVNHIAGRSMLPIAKATKPTRIFLDDILKSKDITSLEQLIAQIDATLNKRDSHFCQFVPRPELYQYLPKLFALINAHPVNGFEQMRLTLNQQYWHMRSLTPLPSPFIVTSNRSALNVAIHVRLGDSLVIDLGSKKVFLHGDVITTSQEQYEQILGSDSSRQAISLADYRHLLMQLFEQFGSDNFSCLLMSDGYARTRRLLSCAISEGVLPLNSKEISQLKRGLDKAEADLQSAFQEYDNVSILLGESNQNLLACIHAFACADVLIYGVGGFSAHVHELFRKNQRSAVTKVDEVDELFFKQIDYLFNGNQAMVEPTVGDRLTHQEDFVALRTLSV
jgi:hypothetical protein